MIKKVKIEKISNNLIEIEIKIEDKEYYYGFSYDKCICLKEFNNNIEPKIFLDEYFYYYKVKGKRHINLLLKETTKEIQKKVEKGTYILKKLN